jgi:secreted PhoX family phosphatase
MTSPAPASTSRRSILRYVGFGAATLTAHSLLGPLVRRAEGASAATALLDDRAWVTADGKPAFAPVAYPVPQPGDGGEAATDATRFATYDVKDDLVLPQGWRSKVVAQWGDRLRAGDAEFVFGFNADYTGLAPVAGARDEFWLIVNHEYISATPWLQGWPKVHGGGCPVDLDKGTLAGVPLAGAQFDLLDANFTKVANPQLIDGLRKLCEMGMADLGVSVLRVRRGADGTFSVVIDSADHFRIAAASHSANVKPDALTFTGPAAALLGGRARGTFSNCSGGVTPWGTFLTCEENFQDQANEFVTPAGRPFAGAKKRFAAADTQGVTKLPFEFEGLGTGLTPPLDGRQYGWVCEVDPVNRTLKKHTSLGRFRHENVAIRVEAGKPVVCYLGDDRRGGHVWKFVSRGVVTDPKDPANSKLLEDGTLHVARFEPDFTGRWIPLTPDTPLRRPEPEHCSSNHVWLPRRESAKHDATGGHVAVGGGDEATMTVDAWVAEILAWPYGTNATNATLEKLTLGHLTLANRGDADEPQRAHRHGAILMDAYAMANAAGGTPTSRPEDIEIHPLDGSVYIAFTDNTGSGDGSPDVRIFPDSKGANSRQYGAIYRIAEDRNDPAAATFTWGKFVSSGEAADAGGGFACADNLVFDPAGNLWMVCDITTPAHNFPVDRKNKTKPGESRFPGVFGNNACFCIPTAGPHAGVPFCFAIGPMECEMTGPTFAPDGLSLLVSIQHPGELNGARGATKNKPTEEARPMKLAARDGSLFTQLRTVPLGSNFPSNKPGDLPRPCVVCITRA